MFLLQEVSALDVQDPGDALGFPVSYIAAEDAGRGMADGDPRHAFEFRVVATPRQVLQGLEPALRVTAARLPIVKHGRQVRHEVNDGQIIVGARPADLAIEKHLQLDAELPADQQAADCIGLRRQPEQGFALLRPAVFAATPRVEWNIVLPGRRNARQRKDNRGQEQDDAAGRWGSVPAGGQLRHAACGGFHSLGPLCSLETDED